MAMSPAMRAPAEPPGREDAFEFTLKRVGVANRDCHGCREILGGGISIAALRARVTPGASVAPSGRILCGKVPIEGPADCVAYQGISEPVETRRSSEGSDLDDHALGRRARSLHLVGERAHLALEVASLVFGERHGMRRHGGERPSERQYGRRPAGWHQSVPGEESRGD